MTPMLHQAVLDPATVAQLFADLATHADILGISAKGGTLIRAGGEGLDLGGAQAALRAGTVRGIQIRYRYQDAEWWDTLMAIDGAIRLVRTRPDFTDATP